MSRLVDGQSQGNRKGLDWFKTNVRVCQCDLQPLTVQREWNSDPLPMQWEVRSNGNGVAHTAYAT